VAALRQGTVRANGLEFPTLEAGPAAGPLALCLHGFPDTSRTWRLLLPELAEAGYHAVAPCMRGYAPSAIPADGRYQMAATAHDALAVANAYDADRVTLIGHDWGVLAAVGAATLAPERVRQLVTIALPHPTFGLALFSNHAQMKRSWYVFFFQLPLADAVAAADDFALIDRLWSDWSPGYVLPREEREHLKRTLGQPGVLGASIGYYRAAFDPARHDPALAADQAKMELPTVLVDTLHLHGREDGCAGVETSEGMERFYTGGFRSVIVDRAGHFLHLEQPQVVHRAILTFLGGGGPRRPAADKEDDGR
jgi:pimeloyl-ACP methyl ester carboxylesterase